jgi:hypothetical protein
VPPAFCVKQAMRNLVIDRPDHTTVGTLVPTKRVGAE